MFPWRRLKSPAPRNRQPRCTLKGFETLEARHMLSASSPLGPRADSIASADQQAQVPPLELSLAAASLQGAAAISGDLTAFRPTTPYWESRAVPNSEEKSLGAGIRINGDDDDGDGIKDRLDAVVNQDNDLARLTLTVGSAAPPEGYEYLLKRHSTKVRVWSTSSKGPEILKSQSLVVIDFDGQTTKDTWVEWSSPNHDSAVISLLSRNIATGKKTKLDQVNFYSFSSIVIALGGENQSPSNPLDPNHGTFHIASTLYDRGHDVHVYDEDVVSPSGAGAAYNEVSAAISQRGVNQVAIFGYSHGGGSTHDLAARLSANAASLGTFSLAFTAYIDAISNASDVAIGAELRLPPGTLFHANYFQPGSFLSGGSVAGSDVDVNVKSTAWGASLTHYTIDDHPNVRADIANLLAERVTRGGKPIAAALAAAPDSLEWADLLASWRTTA